MKEKDVREAIKKLTKVKFFIRPKDDEISWQAGSLSDRIKMGYIDPMVEEDGLVVLRSKTGTWFGDHVVQFSIMTGDVSAKK